MNKMLSWKTVRNDNTFRRVYYDTSTGIQIAVIETSKMEYNPDEPWEWDRITVYFNNKTYVRCMTIADAERLIRRRLNWFTKFIDDLFFVTLKND